MTILDWETVELLITMAAAVGAAFAGVYAVRQGSDDRKRADDQQAEITELKLDLTLLRHDYAMTVDRVEDHEERVRGLEKRRKATAK